MEIRYVQVYFVHNQRSCVHYARSRRAQLRIQNAQNVTHIKERLLDQAVILFNCVSF